jgi:hypothetical protein
MREHRFGALHRDTCGCAACVGVAAVHLCRTSLVHLALRTPAADALLPSRRLFAAI